ncbi:putative acyltransferase [Mycobacterium ulcerans str. Harvey]|uniref:Acyltransferase n=1 Tax=Mycobacterium ulcerans str. Harvey TaxID=1299332 RepID=A0ABP3ANC0_MYCUL|nr:putative acyltransferase [Mycobacterium ulcerans str. Harvey]
MPTVLVLTLIFGFAIAAVSYALVESPCREALRAGRNGPSTAPGRTSTGKRTRSRPERRTATATR